MRKDALLRGLLLALLATLLIPVMAVAASSSSSSSTPSPSASSAVYVESRYQPSKLTIKPRGYYSHVSLQDLAWSGWGQATASAHGTLVFQFCVHESCSVSPFYAEPVVVSLTHIERCRARLSYTVLMLDVEASLPEESFKTYRTSLGACQKQGSGGHVKHR